MAELFQEGVFTSSSGAKLPWKFECDAISAAGWEFFAKRVSEQIWIRTLLFVPTGGREFYDALLPHKDPNGEYIVIVDDVLTTGASMEKVRRENGRYMKGVPVIGVVAFARTKPASWIKPILQFWGPL